MEAESRIAAEGTRQLSKVPSERLVGWSVGWGLNGPLRQYFSLYGAYIEREKEEKKADERKTNFQITPSTLLQVH